MFQYSIETQEKKILPAVPILRNDLTSAQGISVRVLSIPKVRQGSPRRERKTVATPNMAGDGCRLHNSVLLSKRQEHHRTRRHGRLQSELYLSVEFPATALFLPNPTSI